MKYLACSLILTLPMLYADADHCFVEECFVNECEIECPIAHDDYNLFVHRRQVFFAGEFLYWTVEEGALDYAIKMKHAAWGPTDAFAKGHYKIAEYDWCPGFRIWGGWYNEPHYWEVIPQYTWLFDKGHNHVFKPSASDRFINPTWDIFTPTPLAEATSNITLHYHLADLIATRVFDPNPHLRLRLLGGFTFAYITQKWKVTYEDFDSNQDLIKNRWRFLGGGLRMGFTTDWYWTGSYVFITGKVSLATLLGTYENRAFQRTTFSPTPLDNPSKSVRNARYNDVRFAFHTQFLLGPSWQRVYDCWAMELFAGYEFNIWLNLQEVFRSTKSSPAETKETRMANGLFGLHGLTARLTVGF